MLVMPADLQINLPTRSIRVVASYWQVLNIFVGLPKRDAQGNKCPQWRGTYDSKACVQHTFGPSCGSLFSQCIYWYHYHEEIS